MHLDGTTFLMEKREGSEYHLYIMEIPVINLPNSATVIHFLWFPTTKRGRKVVKFFKRNEVSFFFVLDLVIGDCISFVLNFDIR